MKIFILIAFIQSGFFQKTVTIDTVPFTSLEQCEAVKELNKSKFDHIMCLERELKL